MFLRNIPVWVAIFLNVPALAQERVAGEATQEVIDNIFAYGSKECQENVTDACQHLSYVENAQRGLDRVLSECSQGSEFQCIFVQKADADANYLLSCPKKRGSLSECRSVGYAFAQYVALPLAIFATQGEANGQRGSVPGGN